MLEAVLVKGAPDHERKSCYDCRSCQAAVTWWCTDAEARKAHGSSIPGGRGCTWVSIQGVSN